MWKASANSHRHSPISTTINTTTTGARWTRKSLNDNPPRLAMMMLGGSPTRVAVPPMFDANTSASRYGTGGNANRWHSRIVTGATSNTVVTLSSSADATPVIRINRTISGNGRPRARFADQIARYSKTPVSRITLTMIIIPSSRKMTFQSTPDSGEKNAPSASLIPRASTSAAPPSAAAVRVTHRSVAIST